MAIKERIQESKDDAIETVISRHKNVSISFWLTAQCYTKLHISILAVFFTTNIIKQQFKVSEYKLKFMVNLSRLFFSSWFVSIVRRCVYFHSMFFVFFECVFLFYFSFPISRFFLLRFSSTLLPVSNQNDHVIVSKSCFECFIYVENVMCTSFALILVVVPLFT